MHSENTAKIITNYFFFSFHPNVATNLQEFYQSDNTTQVRRVNILNVYFKLKDPFIHCSFTQRNSHLFHDKYSSITNVHYKIYPKHQVLSSFIGKIATAIFLKKGIWLVATFPILGAGNWYRSNSRLYCLQKVQVFYLDIQVMGLLITPQLHYRWTKSLLSSLFYATNRSRGYHMFSA